jgi:hypothetical protein
MGVNRAFRNDLSLIKRPVNKTPREDLLLMDVTQMFWELRELREEVKALKRENHSLKIGKANLEKSNMKLRYENGMFNMSGLYE